MRRYESVVVISAELPEAKVKEETGKIQSFLESHGAQNVKIDKWGIKEVGHRMRKPVNGQYFCFSFETDKHSMIEQLDGSLKITDSVLKFLTLKVNDKVRKFKGYVKKSAGTSAQSELSDSVDETAAL